MKRSILRLLLAVGIACVGLADAEARSKQVRFVGVHPIAPAHGGGFCHIEAPHVHVWAPTDARLQYREHEGDLYFVGDPVAYGWDGPRHSYYGHHPIHVDVTIGDDDDDHDVEYCYLDGPHYHYYAPPPVVLDAEFRVQSGAYWYIGAPPPAYLEARPQLIKVNAVYKPLVYERPVIAVVTPPVGWIGARVDLVAPAVVVETPAVVVPRARARAVAGFSAGLEVHVPAPVLSVEVGLPGVIVGGGVVHEHHHHHDVIVVDKHKHKKHKGWRGRGRGH